MTEKVTVDTVRLLLQRITVDKAAKICTWISNDVVPEFERTGSPEITVELLGPISEVSLGDIITELHERGFSAEYQSHRNESYIKISIY